jgi:hypothetical protein
MVLWIAATGMSLWLFAIWPKTAIGWLCVVAMGPVAFFVLSAVGELIAGAIGALPGIRHANSLIERRTAGEVISATRIAYYLFAFLVALVPLVLFSWWLENKVTPIVPGVLRDWWHQHFN